jgi:hypothetical protein
MVSKLKIAFNLFVPIVFTMLAFYAILVNSSSEAYTDSTENRIEEEKDERNNYLGINAINSEFAGSGGGKKKIVTRPLISSTLFLETCFSEKFKIQKTSQSKGNVIPFYIRFCTLLVYS